jgi:carboxymethylenebutenolidase
MDSYIARPVEEIRTGILVLHAWWGLNDFFKEFCNHLAEEGFLTLAPDLYHGKVAVTIAEAEKLRSKMKHEAASREIVEALQNLKSQSGVEKKSIGVIGFSLGAYWALHLVETCPDDFSATVLFYGTRSGEYGKAQSAFLGHFAETDEYVSDSGRRKLEKSLKTGGKTTDFHVYPGTSHWFFENNNPAYRPEAAALAWERTLTFLKTQL